VYILYVCKNKHTFKIMDFKKRKFKHKQLVLCFIAFFLNLNNGISQTLSQLQSRINVDVSDNVVFPDAEGLGIPDFEITGELQQWHKVTLTIDGPRSSQYGQTVFLYNEESRKLELDVTPGAGPDHARLRYMHPNPFLDFRMTVTFTHESGEPSYRVPGYFAADGNAAETGAMSGNKWRSHLSPDKTGRWNWQVSFVAGVDISINEENPGQPYLPYDRMNGSFLIAESEKSFPDFRSRGRLQYVGKNYLQFAGNGEYFLKAGTDAPETLLAYVDFDGTKTMMEPDMRAWIGPSDEHGLHEYAAHKQDWREGDPTWRGGKGKGLIGGINYLSSKGMNAMSFISNTAGGDGENVWPWVCRHCREHYDVSKLDQWEIVFEHAQQMGLFLHFKLQEQENDAGWPNRSWWRPNVTVPEALDGGTLGRERKLYTRELIARFGHHLALNWNLGEETMMLTEHHRAWSKYLADTDPYGHHIVVHTTANLDHQKMVYDPLLGDLSVLTGASLQTRYTNVHAFTLNWVRASQAAGKPWAVASDEQGPPSYVNPPDPGFQNWDADIDVLVTLHDTRKNVLWGNLMAGGWGVEYFFADGFPHADVVTEDWRSRDRTFDYARLALEFFSNNNIPYWEMRNINSLAGNRENDNSRYCFAKPGEIYIVYLPEGGTAELDLNGVTGRFSVSWYDPRNGGDLYVVLPGVEPGLF
jgi:hypothetical protein